MLYGSNCQCTVYLETPIDSGILVFAYVYDHTHNHNNYVFGTTIAHQTRPEIARVRPREVESIDMRNAQSRRELMLH